ncbi:isopentenyl-diphosphate Delta-isomerase [Pseudotabrizicola formosa]|uniref:isopentenyl-diphosphate Delta-isomerase n=1 Tax=Pseudotabrizicola formosa TaxID=2030009 RepID=UPI000CD2F809|nr:isopentenyl-diphosphate Delta-isomerase [Pseudotabrizicola formosa]
MTTQTEELIPAWVDGKLVPVGKLEVHQRGLRHKAVSVFVIDAGRVLIQRRALSKYHTPGLWANTCCTHPRWTEDAAACAVRRLREELGITGLFPAFADRVEYRADVGAGLIEHELVDIFVAEAGAGLVVQPDPDEVMETRWVDLYDLSAEVLRSPAKFTPWLKIYMTEHMARIFGATVGVGR